MRAPVCAPLRGPNRRERYAAKAAGIQGRQWQPDPDIMDAARLHIPSRREESLQQCAKASDMNPRKHFVANLAGAITTVASPLKTRKLGGGDGPLGFSDVLLTAYTAGLRYAEHCGRPRVPGGRGAALIAVCWPRVAVSQSRIVR